MAEKPNANGKDNGVYVEITEPESKGRRVRETLPNLLNRFASAVLFPTPDNNASVFRRIKVSVADNAPLLPEASRNSARDLILWTRRGSPLRALLVISAGLITSVALTGVLVFALFFLTATVNAIVISLLMSLAAAGGFLALFFALVTAIYISALSAAVFVISFTAFWATVAILITAGWIGFFYTVWLVTRKSFGFAKHSLSATGSALSTYTATRHARHLIHKDSD